MPFGFRDANEKSELFQCVAHCVGHHAIPTMPTPFEGQENFQGRIIHSHSYKVSFNG